MSGLSHEAAALVLAQYLGSSALDDYLPTRPDRCSECGWHIATQGHRPGPRHFYLDPWSEDYGPEDVDGCSQWKPDRVAGIPAGRCKRCGEPLSSLGLIEACRNDHAWCRGCSVRFDHPGGWLLLNPKRRCRRAKHRRV